MKIFHRKKNSPVLSVIVPNYNNGEYISDCLESILSQTFKDFEIVVFDDCSVDGSDKILRRYETEFPEKIKIIYSKENIGVAGARHQAILRSEGEYITSIDSDDYYYDPQKLESEIKIVRRYKQKFKEDVCSFSNAVLVTGEKKLISIRGNKSNIREGDIFLDIMKRTCEIPINFLLKKKIYFDSGGYDMDLPMYEDWDLKIRISKVCRFYYTGMVGTAYRRHGTGLSSRPFNEHIKWLDLISQKNMNLVEDDVRPEVEASIHSFLEKLRMADLGDR